MEDADQAEPLRRLVADRRVCMICERERDTMLTEIRICLDCANRVEHNRQVWRGRPCTGATG